jgi:hypothetical protein
MLCTANPSDADVEAETPPNNTSFMAHARWLVYYFSLRVIENNRGYLLWFPGLGHMSYSGQNTRTSLCSRTRETQYAKKTTNSHHITITYCPVPCLHKSKHRFYMQRKTFVSYVFHDDWASLQETHVAMMITARLVILTLVVGVSRASISWA